VHDEVVEEEAVLPIDVAVLCSFKFGEEVVCEGFIGARGEFLEGRVGLGGVDGKERRHEVRMAFGDVGRLIIDDPHQSKGA
jgi:hypothetical protein